MGGAGGAGLAVHRDGTDVPCSVAPCPPRGSGPSPHVAIREGDLHAQHDQRLGAVVPPPGQQPALSQRGRQAVPGAGAPPALAIPALSVAAPQRGSVPCQPAGPASGNGMMGNPGEPSPSSRRLHLRVMPWMCGARTHQRASVNTLRPLKV